MTTELETGEAVRAHYDAPSEVALKKEMNRLDRHCRAFIAAAPFVVIATSDARGRSRSAPGGSKVLAPLGCSARPPVLSFSSSARNTTWRRSPT